VDLLNILFVGVILALLLASFLADRKATGKALKVGYMSFKNVAAMFLAVFLLIGLFQVFVSTELIQQVMGKGAGVFAPLIGALLGGIAAGPPVAIYPVSRFLLQHQAALAAIAALITAWVSVGTVSLPAEMKILGRRFALSRWVLALVFSILIGYGTGIVVGLV
jgi:uncharacterized membrane protein YraQ (UPF0718 family)